MQRIVYFEYFYSARKPQGARGADICARVAFLPTGAHSMVEGLAAVQGLYLQIMIVIRDERQEIGCRLILCRVTKKPGRVEFGVGLSGEHPIWQFCNTQHITLST